MNALLEQRIETLPAQIPAWMNQAHVPGLSIAVVSSNEIVLAAGFGLANSETKRPVTVDTVFQAASLSKPMAAYAALCLADQGLLDLDRPLVAYLAEPYAPDLPEAQWITTRHVISHSSGLQNWRMTLDDRLECVFQPGNGFRYSGEGYFLLQRALEKILDRSFEELMQQLLLRPLGMDRSTYLWTAEHAAWIAAGHRERGEPAEAWNVWQGQQLLRIAAESNKPLSTWRYADMLQALPHMHPEPSALPNNLLPNAAGSLLTTAPNYAQFLLQILAADNGPIPLSTARLAEMQKPFARLNQWLSWGLGWGLEHEANEQLLWHWGDNQIFQNFALLMPKQQWGVVVLTNSSRGIKVCERIINHLTNRSHACFLWL